MALQSVKVDLWQTVTIPEKSGKVNNGVDFVVDHKRLDGSLVQNVQVFVVS